MTLDQADNIVMDVTKYDEQVSPTNAEMMAALIVIARGAHEVLEIAHRIDSPVAKMIRNHLQTGFRQLDRIRP